MNNAECAEYILKWATNNAIHAFFQQRNTMAKTAARKDASEMWDKQNPDDGVGSFSSNPYRDLPNHEKKQQMDTHAADNANDIMEFIRHNICNLIK